MIIYKIIPVALVLLICSMSGFAQSTYNCPDNATHPQNDSEDRLAGFLNSDGFESVQTILNLPDLQNSTIELLAGSSYSCHEMNDFKSLYITNIDPKKDYTYYKVSNYYLIVSWYSVNTTKNINIIFLDDQYNLVHVEIFR